MTTKKTVKKTAPKKVAAKNDEHYIIMDADAVTKRSYCGSDADLNMLFGSVKECEAVLSEDYRTGELTSTDRMIIFKVIKAVGVSTTVTEKDLIKTLEEAI